MENRIKWDLEDVLVHLGMGRYQYFALILFGIALAYSNVSTLSFVFTAADLNYRCMIPDCENGTASYERDYFFQDNKTMFDKCTRHPVLGYNSSINGSNSCTPEMFDYGVTIPCENWVFSKEETSIVSDFNITCNWEKLTFVGTLNSFGLLLGIPVTGFLADRYGRKITLILGCLFSAICGILRSFSTTYFTFLVLEFVGAALGSGVYPSAFILGMELVSSTKRPLSGMVIGNFYPLGAMLMGLVAWWFKDWRITLRVMYLPGFLFIFYIWAIPESMRWLQTKGYYKQEIYILKKAASVNRKRMSKGVIQFISDIESAINESCNPNNNGSKCERKQSLKVVLSDNMMLWRVILCSYCWMAVFLVFYGLSVTSVNLSSGNKYASFILSNFMEIPAAILTLPIMETFGRRSSQSTIFILTSICCFLCILTQNDMAWMELVFNMLSKLMISISSCIIYIYTAEIFPTELRLSLHALCSTVGRFGSMLAPQMPLLKLYFGNSAPVTLFGIVSIIGGFVILFLPETKDIKLPDTIEEAQHVDKEYRPIS